MRGSVFQFRQALKGCSFFPGGGANGLTGKCEPNVVILDGMTAQPVSCHEGIPFASCPLTLRYQLPMDDIPGALTAYLTRPLQWAQTTRSLWASAYEDPESEASPVVDEISIVGRGARGLGIAIDREIGEARRRRDHEARVRGREGRQAVSPAVTPVKSAIKYQAGRESSRRRMGAIVFPHTADWGEAEAGVKGVRVVEYDFEERR